MTFSRTMLLAAAASLVLGAAYRPDVMVITVSSDSAGAAAGMRIVASAGTVTADGKTYNAGPDTIRVTGSAELRTSDPVMIASFLSDTPNGRVSVIVRQPNGDNPEGRGNVVVVMRTLMGTRLEATASTVPRTRRP